MQTYKTVAEVVDFLETYHHQLHDYYLKHRDTVNSERMQMLLDYISRHEKNIQDMLTTVQEQDRDIILKTWIQYVPFIESILTKEQLPDPKQDIDIVVQEVFDLNDNLIRFYDKMIHQSGIPEPVKEFFQELITMEETKKKQITKIAQQIKGL